MEGKKKGRKVVGDREIRDRGLRVYREGRMWVMGSLEVHRAEK